MKNLIVTVVYSLFMSSCSTLLKHQMKLEEVSKNDAVAIIKFTVLDSDGENISNSCIVRFVTQGKNTPAYKITSAKPFYMKFRSDIKIEYMSCFVGLLVYKYYFDSFEFKTNDSNAYNFGEYTFLYDYKKNYMETSFYKVVTEQYKNASVSEHPNHWANEGTLTLISKKPLDKSLFNIDFPNNNKKQIAETKIIPKNVYVKTKK